MRIINDKKRGVTAGRSIEKKYKYTSTGILNEYSCSS